MRKLIVLTVVVVGGLFILQKTLGQRPDVRNYEYSPDMARTVAYKSQSANPFLANGQTSQSPVPGTIPRGLLPLHYGTSESESIRAGEELRNPLQDASSRVLERGQRVYGIYCQPCHGVSGLGDGPVAKHGFPPPPSLLLDHARKMKDGRIFHIITYGFKNMPSYGAQIGRLNRWRVINYIRKLQESQP